MSSQHHVCLSRVEGTKASLRRKVIACRAMVDEIRSFLPDDVEIEVLDISQHVRPKQLRESIQKAINRLDGSCEVILVGYGLCSNAVVGLKAMRSTLVVPKLHDCIGVFLGSHKAYLTEMEREPAFFLTQGYIRGYKTEASGPMDEVERIAKRYGRERAEELMGRIMEPYKRLVYIRAEQSNALEDDREYARTMAERFKMRYEEIPGTSDLLRRMVMEEWDCDFVVVEPGQELSLEHFTN